MIYTFLITIVFISELIITITIAWNLLKLDNAILKANKKLTNIKPKIQEICILAKGISEQISELVPLWIEKLNNERDKIILSQLERLMSGFLIWHINTKVMRKIKKSKFLRAVWKGLTLVQSMI